MGMFVDEAKRVAEQDAAELKWHLDLFMRIADEVEEDREFLEADGVEIEIDADEQVIKLAREAEDDDGTEIDAEVEIALDENGHVTVGDGDEGLEVDASMPLAEALQAIAATIVRELGLRHPATGEARA